MRIVHDARLLSRETAHLQGQITFKDAFPIDCLVRNFSYIGASLVLPGQADLPDEFDLHIPKRTSRYRVALVWRDEQFCGVRFLRKLPARR
jgi:hypothetical protein